MQLAASVKALLTHDLHLLGGLGHVGIRVSAPPPGGRPQPEPAAAASEIKISSARNVVHKSGEAQSLILSFGKVGHCELRAGKEKSHGGCELKGDVMRKEQEKGGQVQRASHSPRSRAGNRTVT